MGVGSAAHKLIAECQFASWRVLRREHHRVLSDLLQSQWWEADRLRELQVRRLRRLATHAYRNTAHYRRAFDDAGVDPARIDLDTLKLLPYLEKQTIQRAPETLVARDEV